MIDRFRGPRDVLRDVRYFVSPTEASDHPNDWLNLPHEPTAVTDMFSWGLFGACLGLVSVFFLPVLLPAAGWGSIFVEGHWSDTFLGGLFRFFSVHALARSRVEFCFGGSRALVCIGRPQPDGVPFLWKACMVLTRFVGFVSFFCCPCSRPQQGEVLFRGRRALIARSRVELCVVEGVHGSDTFVWGMFRFFTAHAPACSKVTVLFSWKACIVLERRHHGRYGGHGRGDGGRSSSTRFVPVQAASTGEFRFRQRVPVSSVSGRKQR